MREFLKDPDAVLPYTFDWTGNLVAGDTIATSVITVPAGITKDSESNTTTTSTVKLSGGTEGNRYIIKCHITTTLGYADDRSFIIRVSNR